MIKTQEVIEKLDLIDREVYADMLKQVNIPDFYKCIAQFSGLPISEVKDEVIAQYLITWAKNKYRFYKMLGNSLRLDQAFKYQRQDKDLSGDFDLLGREFPAYYFWLKNFKGCKKNKIDNDDLSWQIKDVLNDLHFDLVGSSLTHFFKAKLDAPDTLITKIGRLFENDIIEATHTISINPIDMMLASENPYDWNSCYRLELDRSDSHADGCMAAVLDDTSLITYVWDKEGEYNLYDQFKFKKIRYYRMRGWIAIAQGWEAIHFNSVYPGRGNYDSEFRRQLREIVEKVVADYADVPNKWRKNAYIQVRSDLSDYVYNRAQYRCDRYNYYGYNEYDDANIYVNSELVPLVERVQGEKEFQPKSIKVYTEKILCACGCGNTLTGSDETVEEDDEGICYNGEGFNCCSFYESEPEYKWCPYRDEYCTCHCMEYDDCDEECWIYQDNNPICSLNEDMLCEDPDSEYVSEGVMRACPENCEGCWMWERHHPKEEEEEEKNEEE